MWLTPVGYWESLFDRGLCVAVYLTSPRARTAIERHRAFDELESLGYAPAIAGLCIMIARLARDLTRDVWVCIGEQPDIDPEERSILSPEGEDRLHEMIRKGLRGADWVKAQCILEDETAGMAPADALLHLMQDCALDIEEVEEIF